MCIVNWYNNIVLKSLNNLNVSIYPFYLGGVYQGGGHLYWILTGPSFAVHMGLRGTKDCVVHRGR